MGMRRRVFLNGLPLRINVSLLLIAIALAVISSLSDRGNPRIICLVAAGLLTLAAVGPSSFRFAWEYARRGSHRWVEDPDTVIPGWKQFCQSMGIEKCIKMKVFADSRNAYANGTTIEIGQPLLDSLDSVSIKGVFAHELAPMSGLVLFAGFAYCRHLIPEFVNHPMSTRSLIYS